MTKPLLSVRDLSISFGAAASVRRVVSGVSFTLTPGETVAMVGESGSGKTLIGKAILRILPKGATISGGAISICDGTDELDLTVAPGAVMRKVRGGRISMIFQEPMSAFSPLHTIGAQVREAVTLHRSERGAAARARVIDVFAKVGFPDPERACESYPFELSGGLRQRAMIAMAVIARPSLLIADEPTTALDVTTQAQVLGLIKDVQRVTGMAVLFITHDLGVVANMADRVAVLRKGRLVESGSVAEVLSRPGHPYTRDLIAAAPLIPNDSEAMPEHAPRVVDPVLAGRNLSKTYVGRRRSIWAAGRTLTAISGVDLELGRGETLGVVGESGSGKSTLAKLLLRAQRPDPGGAVTFRGRDGGECDVLALGGEALKAFRRKAQMVFQDPFSSLSPRMCVLDALTEPLRIHGVCGAAEGRQRAAELMCRVGLDPDHLRRHPHAFSGGQRQRICIARALALRPEVIICDEPTSALDVSVQAQVLDLLREVKADMGLSYVFISHNLAVVAGFADRVAVMHRGAVIETAAAEHLFARPRHPYTRALIAASPEPEISRPLDLAEVACGAGEPDTWPEPFRYEPGSAPALLEVEPGHFVRCAA